MAGSSFLEADLSVRAKRALAALRFRVAHGLPRRHAIARTAQHEGAVVVVAGGPGAFACGRARYRASGWPGSGISTRPRLTSDLNVCGSPLKRSNVPQ